VAIAAGAPFVPGSNTAAHPAVSRVPKSYWIVITDHVRRLVQQLQDKDRITRRQIVECLHRRPLRYREEALDLAGKAVEIGLEIGGRMSGGSSRAR